MSLIIEHEWDAPVTLRGLLSHTAGLTVPGFPGYGPDEDAPPAPPALGLGHLQVAQEHQRRRPEHALASAGLRRIQVNP